MFKIIILGDIMGSIGRKALAKKLPELRKKYNPNFVVANCENLAHGCGVTVKTLREIIAAGVDFCTSGNHIWDKKKEFEKVLNDKELGNKIIRPANYKKTFRKLGEGWKIISKSGKKLLIINLAGKILMKAEGEKVHAPLLALREIIKENKKKKIDAIVIDFHAETTSEKRALGWFADGKASLVWGTHTHIPTADAQIQPHGTGYVTDLGMCGARDSVIGENKDTVVESMLHKNFKMKHNIPERGPAVIQGIYAEIKNKKIIKIERILEETEI